MEPHRRRARLRRLAILVPLLALLVACSDGGGSSGEQEPSTKAASGRYVALGDSYSAGPFIPVTDVANGCLRSNKNYPTLVAEALKTDFEDRTCSGADTTDVFVSQRPGIPPQRTALNAETTVVTVGLGGNDGTVAGSLMRRCVNVRAIDPAGSPCRDSFNSGGGDELLQQISGTVGRLTRVLREVHRLAPKARVLVVGYPRIVDDEHTCDEMPLAEGDYAYAEEVNLALTEALRAAAAATDSSYVDLWGPSKGHDVCGDDPWIQGSRNDRTRAAAYHPLAEEQDAVAKIVLDELRED